MKRQGLGMYIHMPFCSSKCDYCDFNSSSGDFHRVGKYAEYICREIEMYKDDLEESTVETIFIGGGTPNSIEVKYIGAIIEKIRNIVGSLEGMEITIEGNPEHYTDEKVRTYLGMGINRFSMGVQSFDREKLKDIGRNHTVVDIGRLIENMRELGAENISIDLMFGLPGQSIYDFLSDVRRAVKIGIDHISLYSLKLEEGTPLYEKYIDREDKFPSEEDEREMYHRAIDILEESGFNQYEISNFSRPTRESRHNIKYWRLEPYIGLGLSAASNIGKERYKNVDKFAQYYNLIDKGRKPIDIGELDYIDRDMEIAEYLILGLRLNRGVDLDTFRDRYGLGLLDMYGEIIEKYKDRSMIEIEDGSLRLTQKGFDLSNQIFCELLPD